MNDARKDLRLVREDVQSLLKEASIQSDALGDLPARLDDLATRVEETLLTTGDIAAWAVEQFRREVTALQSEMAAAITLHGVLTGRGLLAQAEGLHRLASSVIAAAVLYARAQRQPSPDQLKEFVNEAMRTVIVREIAEHELREDPVTPSALISELEERTRATPIPLPRNYFAGMVEILLSDGLLQLDEERGHLARLRINLSNPGLKDVFPLLDHEEDALRALVQRCDGLMATFIRAAQDM